MADVFLSYKREDKALVAELAKALEADGLSVWWDTDLPLGKSYAASISSALAEAKVVIPVWTARSVQSEWVQEEATAGKRRGTLIPIRLEAVEPPIGFGMIQTADLSNWTSGDASHPEWIKLTQSVRAMIAGQGSAAAANPPSDKPVPPRPRKKPLPALKLAMVAVGVVVIGAGFYLGIQQRLVTAPSPELTASAQTEPEATTAAATPHPAAAGEPAAVPEPATSEAESSDPVSFETAAGTQSTARVPEGNPGEISYATGQGSLVNDFVFSPDGKTALSGGNDGTVTLLDARTGAKLKQFSFQSPVIDIAYSKTGSHAVVGIATGFVTMTETASDSEDGRFQAPEYLVKMEVAPDDGSIAVLDQHDTIRIYQADGLLLRTFSGTKSIHGIAWCPASDCLLVWGIGGLLEVWDPFTPRRIDFLRGHAGDVRAASFSADGQRFATAGDDKQVLIWDANTGKRAGALTGLTEEPTALAWSRDGKRIAVNTTNDQVFVWNLDKRQPHVIRRDGGFIDVWITFTPDSKSVALVVPGHGAMAVPIPD